MQGHSPCSSPGRKCHVCQYVSILFTTTESLGLGSCAVYLLECLKHDKARDNHPTGGFLCKQTEEQDCEPNMPSI